MRSSRYTMLEIETAYSLGVGLMNDSYITARSSYASAVLGIVIMSVRPSVTRMLCDEMKERTAEILICKKGLSL